MREDDLQGHYDSVRRDLCNWGSDIYGQHNTCQTFLWKGLFGHEGHFSIKEIWGGLLKQLPEVQVLPRGCFSLHFAKENYTDLFLAKY